MAATAGAQATCTAGLPPRWYRILLRAGTRYMQGAEPEPEPEAAGIEVRWKIQAPSSDHANSVRDSILQSNCNGPGSTTADGRFDYDSCTDRNFQLCHQEACRGHGAGAVPPPPPPSFVSAVPTPAPCIEHTGGKGRRLEQADEENQQLRAKLAAAEARVAQQAQQLKAKDEQLAKKDELLQHCV